MWIGAAVFGRRYKPNAVTVAVNVQARPASLFSAVEPFAVYLGGVADQPGNLGGNLVPGCVWVPCTISERGALNGGVMFQPFHARFSVGVGDGVEVGILAVYWHGTG